MATKRSGGLRQLRRALRGAGSMGAVSIDRAAQLLDCTRSAVQALIRSHHLLTVVVRDEVRVPLSEIRRRR